MATPAENLGTVLDATVAAAPERIALIALDTREHAQTWTYAQLHAAAGRVATALRARGYAPGERIAILAANSARYLAAMLGIQRAGLVAVPVNFKFPAETIAYVINDSGARLVLHDAAHTAVPAGVAALNMDGPAWNGLPPDDGQPAAAVAAHDLALMLYTSGSTGRPKGVRLTHAGQYWTVRMRQAATPLADERALIAAPLYHMNALALALLVLASGASAVLLPQFTAPAYIRAIERYRATWLTAVPPMIAMMLREHALLAATDLSSVRAIRMGSAPVSASLWQQIHTMLPNARVINAYGTTEGGPVVFGPHPDGLPTPPTAVGYPHPAVQVRLAQGPQDAPDTGILELKSPGLMQGYHQRPDLGSPFSEDGYYRTGDVFQRDADGFYTFVGRRDDMFVSGGENIYPAEVERMLERHPAVQQACVVPVEDDIKGTKPVAFVVLRAGQAADEPAIKRFALAHAPAYQHPRHVWFVPALPLASTNKIDRARLLREAGERTGRAVAHNAALSTIGNSDAHP
ncbi:class I adenylate-forming enzyme family protein [Bordetella sp. BOR01]|uniref:class I adenylate-forming enzyme family protein n=1 Tax=Bordetella sp. BOR01 TaxID=2854779 RepID=UPI001C481839|nr:class I adenylate-forming enzyme family protein [Bordetella sp. BOR01]MBV7483895.1 acyl--CoA ligase [Bordetella sp. BOR01]